MKNYRNTSCLLLFAIILSVSCKKTPSATPVTLASDMSATVDGNSWTCSTVIGTNSTGVFVFAGTNALGQTMQLNIAQIKAGKYDLKQGASSSASYKPDNSLNFNFYVTGQDPAGIGVINITSLDTDMQTIEGNYNFTGVNVKDGTKKNITGGSFTNLPYRDMNRTTTLTATVNGKSWVNDKHGASAGGSPGNFSVEATATDGSYIFCYIPSDIKTGTYQLTKTGAYSGSYQNNVSNFTAESGTLTITGKSATVIKGTFSFTAVDNKNASNKVTLSGGSFLAEIY